MNKMEKEFIPYEQALDLKELGFKEVCLMYWNDYGTTSINRFQLYNEIDEWCHDYIEAPTFSQAFRWFREKYNIYAIILPSYADDKVVKDRFFYEIANGRKLNQELNYHNTYEEAELACLEKLIQIVKK